MLRILLSLIAPVGLCPVDAPVPVPVMAPGTAPVFAPGSAPAFGDEELRAAYADAVSFEGFLAAAEARRDLWVGNWERSDVPATLLERARALVRDSGPWRILAIAVDSCSDSVSTVPYLARLAEQVEGLDLRVLDPDRGAPWMEAHRSPDGRPTTPTVLLLDADYELRGCFVEQPEPVQDFWLPALEAGTARGLMERKMQWYTDDAGRTTMAEFVDILAAASTDQPICPGM